MYAYVRTLHTHIKRATIMHDFVCRELEKYSFTLRKWESALQVPQTATEASVLQS